MLIGPAPTSAKITVHPPAGNPEIDEFEAFIQNGLPEQKCSVPAKASVLECTINTLDPTTSYTALLRACLPKNSGCGSTISKAFETIPLGKHIEGRLYDIATSFNELEFFLKRL